MSGTTGEVRESHFSNCSGSFGTGLEMWDPLRGNFNPNLDLRRSSVGALYVGSTSDTEPLVEPLDRLKGLVPASLGATAPCIRTWRPVIPSLRSQKM
jgi:hypothetical protein